MQKNIVSFLVDGWVRLNHLKNGIKQFHFLADIKSQDEQNCLIKYGFTQSFATWFWHDGKIIKLLL